MLKAEIKGIGIPEKGTPQGGILSPLLANIVLNELDWWISKQWENFNSNKGVNSMKKIMFFILGLMLNIVPAMAEGEGYSARYVNLGHQSAVVYQPTMKSVKTGVGIVVMHSDEDYMGFLPNPELSKRGYTVIATVPTQSKVISEKLLNIKACVKYLRNQPDIKKVILLGHSGGATVMTAYQLVAEKGKAAFEGK